MSNANLAGRANEFPLPGKLALLAFRPSRELAAFVMETLARGRVSNKIHGGDQREVSKIWLVQEDDTNIVKNKHPRIGRPTRECCSLSLLRETSCLSHFLQFDRFNFGDEALVAVSEERADDVEHGVTETTDVHDVSSLTCLDRLVRLEVDADQLRSRRATSQLAADGRRRFPKLSSHRSIRDGPRNPTLVVADQYNSRKLAFTVQHIGSF